MTTSKLEYNLTFKDFLIYQRETLFRSQYFYLNLILIGVLIFVGITSYVAIDDEHQSLFILSSAVLFALMLAGISILALLIKLFLVSILKHNVGIQNITFDNEIIQIRGNRVERLIEVQKIEKVKTLGRVCIIYHNDKQTDFLPQDIFQQLNILKTF